MKLKNQPRLVRSLLFICALVQVLYFVLAWTGLTPHLGTWHMQVSARGMGWEEAQQLSAAQWSAGIALGLPALLCILFGLMKLNRLLQALQLPDAQKTMFSLGNIACLHSFAGALALSTLFGIIEVPVRHLIFTLLPGVYTHRLSVSVNAEELMLLLVCLVFYLVTGMLHEGRRLAEENEGFI
ncbi:DUF2975 domain-containing protein [Undibacterium sp. JH2W]|uniref:DUF2975 domain-containing protein n=1 Tax=Undibacterium sp. JH2W TaxID=3413037 RepID=UPI003BEFB16C